MNNEKTLKCPYCKQIQADCECPDLFYEDDDNPKGLNKQAKLLKEVQNKGFNIVTCGHCGQVFIHKL